MEGDLAPPGPPAARPVRGSPGARTASSRGRPARGGARRDRPRTSSRSPTSTTCRYGRAGRRPWPAWADRGAARPAGRARGHRAVAAPGRRRAAARDGRHVVVATGTASGKSLAYQLPALTRLAEDPRACVLYLAPTKALARDQLASVAALADPSVRPAAYDGDTPGEERDWVRRHSRWIVTNPDMLHRGILPAIRSGPARCAGWPTS